MRKTLSAVVCILCVAPLWAQQRPLVTEPANPVGEGKLRFELGFEFLQDAVFPFSGLEGDLNRLGVLGFRLGVGKSVELQLLGTVQDVLNVDRRFPAPNSPNLDFTGNSTSDVGDFTLATKVRFLEQHGGHPALGFRFGVDLPNTSNESGLGNDELNAFGSFLLESKVGNLNTIVNLGLVILGDPTDANSQDDLFTYGWATIYSVNDRVHLVSDLYGRTGSGGIGTEEQLRLRLGAQFDVRGVYFDIGGFFGFQDTDPDTGIIFGISKGFSIH